MPLWIYTRCCYNSQQRFACRIPKTTAFYRLQVTPASILRSVYNPTARSHFSTTASNMKRAAATTGDAKSKKRRVELPEYHATPSLRTEEGEIIWPAPQGQIEAAKDFISEW